MKNKKATSIPITLLVIGTFLICAFALFSFIVFDYRHSNSFSSIALTRNMDSMIEEYHFYKNQNMSEEKLESILNITTDSTGEKFLYLEQKQRLNVVVGYWEKETLQFSVKYILPP